MAVNLPNFLSASLTKPDYSALGDVVKNYYAGKAMPKDDLIKAIQAKYAEPKAQEGLRTTQLANQKTAMELAEQQQFEKQFREALGRSGASPVSPQQQQPTMQTAPAGGAALADKMTMMNDPAEALRTIDPNLTKALTASMGGGQPQAAQAMSEQGSFMQQPMVMNEGSPHAYGIDEMYENYPAARPFLEKKGYKKKQDIKFDNKTGKTSIITTYPSGRVTVQTSGGSQSDDGMPLTNKMISKHQNVVSSVDNAIPVIEQIMEMDKHPRWSVPVVGSGDEASAYDALVNQGLDTLIGAFGLPQTQSAIDSVKQQLQIGHMESEGAYKKRLKDLIKDLRNRQKYAADQVKKSVNIRGDDSEDSDSYGLSAYDNAGENDT